MAIDQIQVVDRHRLDLGDLHSLAASMRDLGQLQPIVVTSDLRLVAGGRRLAAARSLGWDSIEVTVAESVSDAATLLRAEQDENTCRKPFTPTEEYSLYSALLALELPKVESKGSGVDDATAPPYVGTKARQAIAEIITGSSGRHKTLDKIGEVKRIALDETKPARLREVAQEALKEIDTTRNIAGAYARVKLTARAVAATQEIAEDHWTSEERRLIEDLRAGKTVVVSMREVHDRVVQWARSEGLLFSIDRKTEWGNPFEMPYDGDRATVIKNFADHYLPHKPSLLSRLPELKGKALACWCAPEPCHGDALIAAIHMHESEPG